MNHDKINGNCPGTATTALMVKNPRRAYQNGRTLGGEKTNDFPKQALPSGSRSDADDLV